MRRMPISVNKRRHTPTTVHIGDKGELIREASLSIHIRKHANDITFLNNFEISASGVEEDLCTNLVHDAWKSLACCEDATKRAFGKYRFLHFAYGHVVTDISARFIFVHTA